MIYFLIVLVAIGFAWICAKAPNSKLRNVCFILTFLAIAIPAACRYGIGTDFEYYLDTIRSIYSGERTGQELSYNLIVEFVHLFTDEPQAVFVLYASLTYLISLAIFPRDQFHYAVFGFLLHYYAFTLSGIRQGLALSTAFCAIYYVCHAKYVPSLLFCGLSMFLHNSAGLLFLIVMYVGVFARKHYSLLVYVFGFVGALLWGVDSASLILSVVAHTPYKYYLDHPEYTCLPNTTTGLGYLIPALMFFSMFAALYSRKNMEDLRNRRIALLCGFSFFVYALSVHLSVFRRFSIIADCILPFAVCELARRKDDIICRGALVLVCFCLVTCFCKEILSDANYGIQPYVSIFDEGVSLW